MSKISIAITTWTQAPVHARLLAAYYGHAFEVLASRIDWDKHRRPRAAHMFVWNSQGFGILYWLYQQNRAQPG